MVGRVYRFVEFAERIGCSAGTVRRWEVGGRVKRLPSVRRTVVLGRGPAVDEWVREVGGGMDLGRRRFLAVMDAVERAEVATLVVAHRDQPARFGFDFLEHVAARHGGGR